MFAIRFAAKLKLRPILAATTLEKSGASVVWGLKDREEFSSPPDRLHLRQILLGHTAKADEYNVVEVSQIRPAETSFSLMLRVLFH